MELRIHHFFDIIRDFGTGKEIMPYPIGHSYHKVAEMIRNNPDLSIILVVHDDKVCTGCRYLKDNRCNDLIKYRLDFTRKEELNNYLDRRILSVCSLNQGDVLTAAKLCKISALYLDNIEWIYAGNDKQHTKIRKKKVVHGLKYYMDKHRL